jgi:long-subunit fatty acid transport protein
VHSYNHKKSVWNGPAGWGLLHIFWCLAAAPAGAQSFTINTPAGPVEVRVSHAGPSGNLVAPPAPEAMSFRPPSVFSAPLPSGSGARALGLAGAFTALADDATAASWNPAGLIQLEHPEASVVLRYSRERDKHHSGDDDFDAGRDDFDSENLNYFSVVFPFHLRSIERNMVVSLNYQEAYDFTQEFSARLRTSDSDTVRDRSAGTFRDTQVDHISDGVVDITVRSFVTTETETTFNQILSSGLLTDLDFQQEGVISALTPAFALEVTPKLSLGVAFNVYFIDPLTGDSIRSRTRAEYSGRSDSRVNIRTTQASSGTYEYDGTVDLPGGGGLPPVTIPVSGSGEFDPFTSTRSAQRNQSLEIDGVYEEINEFTDLNGYNFTLGLLYTVNRLVSVGASVDMPWTAEANQKKTVRNTVTTFNADRTQVLDVMQSEDTQEKDVEFEFPLFWNAGVIFRWTPSFYTTFDVGQTLWSDFSFKAEGEGKINPLDGSPHGENPLDDTWSARAGAEYLVVLSKTEIPIRAGVAWEERPALGQPDEFWSFSLGSGLSVGQEPNRTFIDFAYVVTIGDNVKGVIPEQADLTSDIVEQQFFVSMIKHFR